MAAGMGVRTGRLRLGRKPENVRCLERGMMGRVPVQEENCCFQSSVSSDGANGFGGHLNG